MSARDEGEVALVRYDALCRELAEAVRVDEVKNILDAAVAMRAYAKQAKNREAEANAIELRMRATRKLDRLVQAQKKTIGLAKGGQPYQRRPTGLPANPVATLAMQGIDKTLAHQARVLGRLSEPDFERKLADARSSASGVFRRVVREAEIEQERAERRAQTAQGGSVADLHSLIASGFRSGVVAVDPPWLFDEWSDRAGRSVREHYEPMPLDEIKALPVAQLAADDCALFMWATWALMPVWHEVIAAWGFTFSGLGFDWVKLKPNGEGLHIGTGSGTRANPEPCLLAKRGSPLRLDAGVHSVIIDSGRCAFGKARRGLCAHATALPRSLPRTVRAQAARRLEGLGQRASRRGGRRMTARMRLPNRRASTHFEVELHGLRFIATFSRFPDGRVAEVFLSNHKPGSQSDSNARDAAVAASLALQFGCPLDILQRAVLRDPAGDPATPLGAALDAIAAWGRP